jgi:hypothetical protein
VLASFKSPPDPSMNTIANTAAKIEYPLASISTLPKAEREDYPMVKYWHRHEWNSESIQVAVIGAPGKTRASQGENVTMKFIEDENGNIIDGYRASIIRKFARELWSGLANIGKAPKTWGKVDARVATEYRTEMGRKFPELQLCDDDWKADLIATINYPSWYSNNVEKEDSSKRVSTGTLPMAKRVKGMPSTHAKRKNDKHVNKNVLVDTNTQALVSRPLEHICQFSNAHKSDNTSSFDSAIPSLDPPVHPSLPSAEAMTQSNVPSKGADITTQGDNVSGYSRPKSRVSLSRNLFNNIY